jgi:hypothetical protein
MKWKVLICGTLMVVSLNANESMSSEISHFVGGTVMAGGITAIVDHYYPEYRDERGMIGFEISSAAVIVEQSLEFAFNGNAKGQLLDAAAHIAGSALGACITDQYILSPVIKNSASEGTYVGVSLRRDF